MWLRGIAAAGSFLLIGSGGCVTKTSELWVESRGAAVRYDQSACEADRSYSLTEFKEVEPFESAECLQKSWCSWYPHRVSGQPAFASRSVWEGRAVHEDLPVVPSFDAGEKLLLDGVVHALEVEDGWLIALTKDDSGQLLWTGPDGTRGALLARGRVTAYHRFDDAIFAVERGRVLRVARDQDGRWIATAVYTSSGVIRDSARLAGSMRLLEDAGVKTLSLDGELRVEHSASWTPVQPNGLLLLGNGVMLIGAHHVVIRLDPIGAGYAEKWLALPGCAALMRDAASNRCFCRG